MTCNEYLKILRLKRSLSLRDVQVLTGISNAHICQIEQNKRNPNIKTLLRLCEAYKISISKFWKDLNKVSKVEV